MELIKKYLPWTVRIIISLLFLLSGVTKMFPLWAFEKQIVDLGLGSWCFAHYFSRFIIALELSVAVAILQPHYLKNIVIPGTILLLIAFCLHLSIDIYQHGNKGNCGCFGQFIKMTPLEALIKNIITIGLMIYLFLVVKQRPKGENKLGNLIMMYLVSTLILFVGFPFAPCKAEAPVEPVEVLPDTVESTKSDLIIDSPKETTSKTKVLITDSIPKALEEKSPKKVKSIYASHTSFGDKKVNLDEGKKLLCFFAPGCDHCQDAAKEICKMAEKPDFPKVYIIFMDEEAEKIPDFFKIAKCNFPYKILDIPSFFKVLGDAQTPGIKYIWNGNILKSYDGTGDNKFDAKGLLKACNAKYK